jgi:hypothetical protein
MKDLFVPYEIAKQLKEKDFNEPCFGVYGHNGENVERFLSLAEINVLEEFQLVPEDIINSQIGDNVSAPLYQQVTNWLTTEHGRYIMIIPTITASWTYHTIRVISKVDDDVILGIKYVDQLPPYKGVTGEDFSTYYDALDKAIEEVIKLI